MPIFGQVSNEEDVKVREESLLNADAYGQEQILITLFHDGNAGNSKPTGDQF